MSRIPVCLLAASLCAAARAQSIRTGAPLRVPAAGSGAAQAGAAGQAAASAPADALNPTAGGLPPALTLPYAAPVLPSIGPQLPRSGMSVVVAGGKGANSDTEGFRQSDRALILGVRKRIRALVAGLREGRVWDELERLARNAFADGDGVQTESARVLLRFIGDPQLIVQSRGFIASVGLGDAVDLDAVSRAVFQARPPDAGRKELMSRLKSNSSVEFDEALPRVKPRTRKLFLATPRFRLRGTARAIGDGRRAGRKPDARGRVLNWLAAYVASSRRDHRQQALILSRKAPVHGRPGRADGRGSSNASQSCSGSGARRRQRSGMPQELRA